MFIFSKKKLWASSCPLNQRATRAAHFNGAVQLALGVDRFGGALELPETWEIVGPARPQEHLSQSA